MSAVNAISNAPFFCTHVGNVVDEVVSHARCPTVAARFALVAVVAVARHVVHVWQR